MLPTANAEARDIVFTFGIAIFLAAFLIHAFNQICDHILIRRDFVFWPVQLKL